MLDKFQQLRMQPFASSNPNYKPLATAQMTITDQTDASNLAGNMTVVSGSKSQIFLTGSSNPFSPDWKANHLVLRPFMIASNITKGQGDSKYNPDLFDPYEYADLESTGDAGIQGAYIKDIQWYLIDTAGNQILIDATTNTDYSHEWTYTNGENNDIAINDKRNLVIKNNIVGKDNSASIMIKFSFKDPYADINIPVSYMIDLNCISTGIGNSKVNINSINGTSFYNNDPEKLMFVAEYFKEGIKEDLQGALEKVGNTNVKWFIRTQEKDGWALLNPVTQDDANNEWNVPGEDKAYEIHRIVSYDAETNKYVTEKTKNAKGGVVLYIYPGLIAGSDIVKLTVQDGELDGQNYSTLETLYDYTDPTRAELHSSNGDKLYKGQNTIGTVMKAIVIHNGELLGDGAPEYGEGGNTNTRIFDYYWYKYDDGGNTGYNIWMEGNVLKEKNMSDSDYTPDNGFPKKSSRSINIKPDNIDNKATFSLDLLNRRDAARYYAKLKLLEETITEDDLYYASINAAHSGLDKFDIEEVMPIALEDKKFYLKQMKIIKESKNNK